MKARTVLPLVSLALFASAAYAQDAVKADPAHYRVAFEIPAFAC